MKSTIKIQNLKCHGCATTIIKKLNLIKNISAIEVNNDNQTVSFLYENKSDLDVVKGLLQKLGYPEEGEKNSLGEKAKSIVSCAMGKIS